MSILGSVNLEMYMDLWQLLFWGQLPVNSHLKGWWKAENHQLSYNSSECWNNNFWVEELSTRDTVKGPALSSQIVSQYLTRAKILDSWVRYKQIVPRQIECQHFLLEDAVIGGRVMSSVLWGDKSSHYLARVITFDSGFIYRQIVREYSKRQQGQGRTELPRALLRKSIQRQ
jgi:hypothetical protein